MRDAELIAALAKFVEERPGGGFGKCCQRWEKSHPHWNDKRIYRVYCAMKLNLRRAASRRLLKRECMPPYLPEQPDTVWPADFMLDALVSGRSFRTFNVIDDFDLVIVDVEVDESMTSQRLVRIFEQIRQARPLPQVLRTDDSPEFLKEAFTQWAKVEAIQHTQPSKPNQNAYIEPFNRTYHEDLLDRYPFARLGELREAPWRLLIDYNEHRERDALYCMTPIEYHTNRPNVLILICRLDGRVYVAASSNRTSSNHRKSLETEHSRRRGQATVKTHIFQAHARITYTTPARNITPRSRHAAQNFDSKFATQ